MNAISFVTSVAAMARASVSDTKPAARRVVGRTNNNKTAQKAQRKARKKNR